MIIKGGAAGNVGWWSQHLQRDDTNERAEVMEISGLLSENLPSALREMQAIAAQSRSGGNFMYQANINPEANERLTPEQWQEAIDTLEKNLGLEGHQRVVVEHEKHGRVHRHIVWNRVDVETLRVTDIGGNYYTHERTARDLENRFDLSPTPTPHGQRRPEGRADRAPELWEQRAAERSGIDPKQITAELTQLWRTADSGSAFAAALEERGYILAQGTRRDFCIVDQAGDVHSLARRIEGAKGKDVRERLDHLDPASLPTVEDARATQREKYPTRDAARAAWEGRDTAPAPSPAREQEKPTQTQEAERTATTPPRSTEDRAQENWRKQRDAEVARVTEDKPTRTASSPLRVSDAATGVVDLLGNFVDALLGCTPPPAVEGIEKIRAQRRALAALENIRESMERGEDLNASDITKLTPTHLENIKLKGDDYIRQMIESLERDRERERDYSRTRER